MSVSTKVSTDAIIDAMTQYLKEMIAAGTLTSENCTKAATRSKIFTGFCNAHKDISRAEATKVYVQVVKTIFGGDITPTKSAPNMSSDEVKTIARQIFQQMMSEGVLDENNYYGFGTKLAFCHRLYSKCTNISRDEASNLYRQLVSELFPNTEASVASTRTKHVSQDDIERRVEKAGPRKRRYGERLTREAIETLMHQYIVDKIKCDALTRENRYDIDFTDSLLNDFLYIHRDANDETAKKCMDNELQKLFGYDTFSYVKCLLKEYSGNKFPELNTHMLANKYTPWPGEPTVKGYIEKYFTCEPMHITNRPIKKLVNTRDFIEGMKKMGMIDLFNCQNEELLAHLYQVYKLLNTDNDKVVSYDEFKKAITKHYNMDLKWPSSMEQPYYQSLFLQALTQKYNNIDEVSASDFEVNYKNELFSANRRGMCPIVKVGVFGLSDTDCIGYKHWSSSDDSDDSDDSEDEYERYCSLRDAKIEMDKQTEGWEELIHDIQIALSVRELCELVDKFKEIASKVAIRGLFTYAGGFNYSNLGEAMHVVNLMSLYYRMTYDTSENVFYVNPETPEDWVLFTPYKSSANTCDIGDMEEAVFGFRLKAANLINLEIINRYIQITGENIVPTCLVINFGADNIEE